VAVLVVLGFGRGALATESDPIKAAGNDKLVVIDANQNGMLDEPDDCVVSANTDGESLRVRGTQSTGATSRLLLCSDPEYPGKDHGDCWGDGFVGSDFAQANLGSCDFGSAPFVPMSASFCASLGSCLSDSHMSLATGSAGQAAGPIPLTAGVVFQTLFEPVQRSGFGQVCNAGGPAAQITGDDGVTVLRELRPFPNSQSPTHMCVDDVPVQLLLGGKVMRTACFPVSNGMTPLSVGDGDPFAIIDFTALAGCAGGKGAPTMSEWGLIALMAGLLAIGTWTLGRRRSFYESLPLP
jgi:hypothetical protein